MNRTGTEDPCRHTCRDTVRRNVVANNGIRTDDCAFADPNAGKDNGPITKKSTSADFDESIVVGNLCSNFADRIERVGHIDDGAPAGDGDIITDRDAIVADDVHVLFDVHSGANAEVGVRPARSLDGFQAASCPNERLRADGDELGSGDQYRTTDSRAVADGTERPSVCQRPKTRRFGNGEGDDRHELGPGEMSKGGRGALVHGAQYRLRRGAASRSVGRTPRRTTPPTDAPVR